MADSATISQGQTPTIVQDDLPFTSTLSFESGGNSSSTMMDSNPPSVLTDTLSSFSSGNSSNYLGSSNSNSNSLSTIPPAASASASRRNSVQATQPVEVRETLDASVRENADGFLQLKQYIFKGEIGKGAYGKVHLAVDENTGVGYAVKEFSKSKLRKKDMANLFKLGPRGRGRGRRGPEATSDSSPLDLIRGEIAILKKLHHPNIVKLYEVLDVASDDSMYMVFEWCEKGVLMPVSLTEKYEHVFPDGECRDIFQQMILGIEYLHEHDIIHRDIKPDNLLRSKDDIVKIVDFGVSEMFDKKGDDMTKKSAGSPAFMAPELCRPDHGEVSGRATDVWSMGVTLFCLRYGRLPYVSESILEMQRVIREDDFVLPPDETDPRFVNLIRSLLEKDPAKRITIDQLRNDPWVTNDGQAPLISKEENTANAVTEVTEEDLRGAIQRISSLATVFKAIFKLKRGIKSPPRSSVASPLPSSEGQQGDAFSEAEKMEDADEQGTASIAQVLGTENGAELKPESLEGTLDRVSLEEDVKTNEAQEEQQKREEAAIAAAATATTTPEMTIAETTSERKETGDVKVTKEEAKEEGEPEGYEMCDMESGLCYWVPAQKSKPTPRAVEEPAKEEEEEQVPAEKEEEQVPEVEEEEQVPEVEEEEQVPEVEEEEQVPAEEEKEQVPAEKEEEEEREPEGYQICDMESGLCYWVPAQKSKRTTPADPVDQALAHSVTPPPESTASAADTTRTLAPGPRLVGKLSRERFAMFEKKD